MYRPHVDASQWWPWCTHFGSALREAHITSGKLCSLIIYCTMNSFLIVNSMTHRLRHCPHVMHLLGVASSAGSISIELSTLCQPWIIFQQWTPCHTHRLCPSAHVLCVQRSTHSCSMVPWTIFQLWTLWCMHNISRVGTTIPKMNICLGIVADTNFHKFSPILWHNFVGLLTIPKIYIFTNFTNFTNLVKWYCRAWWDVSESIYMMGSNVLNTPISVSLIKNGQNGGGGVLPGD